MKRKTGAGLRPNGLGWLLGKATLEIDGDALVALKRGREIRRLPLHAATSFAICSYRILGATLQIEVEGQKYTFGFMRSRHAAAFLDPLNNALAVGVCCHIDAAIMNFRASVIDQFPRDSWMEQIEAQCASMSTLQTTQASLCERYLPAEHVKHLAELASFHPVRPEALRTYHEQIQLAGRAAFFEAVESNPLTQEQRLAVLRSNDRNLVLAAAGTGKTSVIVAKTLDLIDRGLARPDEILVLAYNRSAAEELGERLDRSVERLGLGLAARPEISTFHALGRRILQQAKIRTYMSVFADDATKLEQWVTAWLEAYLQSSPKRLGKFISLFPPPVNPFEFRDIADYERYVRDNELRTLKGDLTRGYQELVIANALFLNGVPYTYEAPYVSQRRIEPGYNYRPDFHLSDTNIYIEHFGIDRNGGTAPGIDAEKYNAQLQSKRALHQECGTGLVETYHYEWIEGVLVEKLLERLAQQGVPFNPLAPEVVLEQLRSSGKIAACAGLLVKALQAIRVEHLDREGIEQRLKRAKFSAVDDLVELLDALHEAYVAELRAQDAIDFDDMIIRAIDVIDSGAFVPKWKYVLVDEFQDISQSRMALIRSVVAKGPAPSLTVVGDDWQSIYRFSGGKLELTTRFRDLVGAMSETKLQKTFRYNNSIADVAGSFVMQNPEQYRKKIETHTIVDRSQIHVLDDYPSRPGGLYLRLAEVVRKIRTHDPDGSIAVIARYNYLLRESEEALKRQKLGNNVRFWTFHRSKGLEADYCVLIGFSQGRTGFPNENRDEAFIEALLPSLDGYRHSEERRLLYVGLTRARNKAYLIASPVARSDFIQELISGNYDVNISSPAFVQADQKTAKCPHCSDGYFHLIEGQYGDFYVCSTGRGCRVGKARTCTTCGAASVDGMTHSVCTNPACAGTMRICEKCGRPMKLREGRFGKFWGCSGYASAEDQCTNTGRYTPEEEGREPIGKGDNVQL